MKLIFQLKNYANYLSCDIYARQRAVEGTAVHIGFVNFLHGCVHGDTSKDFL